MWNVITWELRRRRSAILWWSIGSVIMTVVILALYPSIRDQANDLNKVINSLPQGLRELKTGGANDVNVADPAAFLNSQLFYATLPIIWIILAITRGSGILGKEEQSTTLELLVSRPISRSRLLVAKALSFVSEFFIVGGVTLLCIVLMAPIFELHIGTWELAVTTIYTILFSLSFGYIAFALQAAGRFARRAASVTAVAIGFGGYLIASLSGLTDWLKVPAKFVPYHYFTPNDVLLGHTPRGLVVYLVGVFILGSLIALFGFRRRDIG
jgi:ABC-2 type transport system permease protein